MKSAEQISARARGTSLKVVLARHLREQATALDFVRNDDEPGHASLVTLVPGAHRAVTIADPSAGDALIVVPGHAGHALLDVHHYMEFAALPSAAGSPRTWSRRSVPGWTWPALKTSAFL